MDLTCPKDAEPLTSRAGKLCCARGHEYRVVEGVPVLLRDDVPQTIGLAAWSLEASDAPLYLSSVGISDAEREVARGLPAGPVDPVASVLVAATSGYAYKHLVGALAGYPIPRIALPEGRGLLLDIGCSWGRWSIAAARKGYSVVGIDPSLGAVLAAQRVARQLGADARFICADGRFLPFAPATFDVAHSYSVLQHLATEDVRRVVAEISRVLRPRGRSVVQMAHKLGLRSLYHQARRRGAPQGFDVRYRGIGELRELFSSIGPTRISAHCFGGLGLERSDLAMYSRRTRLLTAASERLVAASRVVRPLQYLADSVYVTSDKP